MNDENEVVGSRAARQKVWVAMSDLFLDTELSSDDLTRLSSQLAESPFTVAELTSIYEDEVAPVLYSNLHSVAGVWGAFDAAEVIELVRKRLDGLEGKNNIRGVGPFAWIRRWYMLSQSEPEWQVVLMQLQQLRRETRSSN